MSERRHLNFADAPSVAREVLNLQAGYRQAGNWTLPQICWHLNQALRYAMARYAGPPVANDPEKAAMVEKVLSSGAIPSGISAPERVVPPDDVPEMIVDEFVDRLAAMASFEGPFAPHPVFGQVETEKYKKLFLIHCAHHLGFVTPVDRRG